jgi:murein DD-endopeptidase MepM/ murein hydrolase activator NlpD
MGYVGTPIIAVEDGYVEALGWNKYGGWRIGIRSFDKKRYYYYAHLRKNFPYHKTMKVGALVKAGDVIGYLGRSGYSTSENTNNIITPHLHFGMQLIFDESQKEGINEIWIDVYDIVELLQKNKSEVFKDSHKEYWRVYNIRSEEPPEPEPDMKQDDNQQDSQQQGENQQAEE